MQELAEPRAVPPAVPRNSISHLGITEVRLRAANVKDGGGGTKDSDLIVKNILGPTLEMFTVPIRERIYLRNIPIKRFNDTRPIY